MLSIHIDKFTCWGFHGIHPEETLLGNQFEINLTIDCIDPVIPITQLSQTIDYVGVVALVKKRMQTPTALLETIASDICLSLFHQFPLADKVAISIYKIVPPIQNWNGRLGISIVLERTQCKIP